MHFRKLYDERFIGSWDLEGKESAVVTIKSISVEELHGQNGLKAKKPVLYFTKGKKGFVLNKTNAKTIAELYGSDTDKWIDKKIELFATVCDAFGKQTECIRISNKQPE